MGNIECKDCKFWVRKTGRCIEGENGTDPNYVVEPRYEVPRTFWGLLNFREILPSSYEVDLEASEPGKHVVCKYDDQSRCPDYQQEEKSGLTRFLRGLGIM